MKGLFCLIACLLVSGPAFAEPGFSQPPHRIVDENGYPRQPAASVLRLGVGPAALFSERDPAYGLGVALDIGSGAAGARLSGAFIQAGSENGLSQYNGEVFVDFGRGRALHPIIAAGAAVARVARSDPGGELEHLTIGVGVLRATLEYQLPVLEADARAGLDLSGNVPAIVGESGYDESHLLCLARVSVGF